MRIQSDTRVKIRGKVIGGKTPLICLPLVAGDKAALLQQAEDMKRLRPDLFEWRADGYDGLADPDDCLDLLKALRRAAGSIPLIFTCRSHEEGGLKELDPDLRLRIVTRAVASGDADIVDVELCSGAVFVDAVKKAAAGTGVRLILSYHNFSETPDGQTICDTLFQARDMGADIAKVAVMPRDYNDVLTLLDATLRARTGGIGIPVVAVSMGTVGLVSRLAGGLFGSDITFAMGRQASAPGQVPIGDLRQAMSLLYEQDGTEAPV